MRGRGVSTERSGGSRPGQPPLPPSLTRPGCVAGPALAGPAAHGEGGAAVTAPGGAAGGHHVLRAGRARLLGFPQPEPEAVGGSAPAGGVAAIVAWGRAAARWDSVLPPAVPRGPRRAALTDTAGQPVLGPGAAELGRHGHPGTVRSPGAHPAVVGHGGVGGFYCCSSAWLPAPLPSGEGGRARAGRGGSSGAGVRW